MDEAVRGMKRTHYCGRLTEENIGETVTVMGWMQRRRDLGGVIFIDLRDASGIVQVVIDAGSVSEDDFAKGESLRNEYVLAIRGKLERRDIETVNLNIPTGTIDVRAHQVEILNRSKTPPFMIDEYAPVREELRLKYRYIDLRRKEMLDHLRLRQNVLRSARECLMGMDFLEIETPILTKSTPEGARDYLVPSRVNKGSFFALPQSPQIYKQLLMVSGVDRYFQVAKCFRDEDLRADRQPEFTQVDMEMSFVDEEDIIEVLETLFAKIFNESKNIHLTTPFRRLTYKEAMDSYGFDKPDLRFEMPMVDLTEIMQTCSFDVFRKVVDGGGIVKGLCVKDGNNLTRTQIELLTEKAFQLGGKGMAWIAIEPDGTLRSVLTKYFSEDDMSRIMGRIGAQPGDMIVFSADKEDRVRHILGHLRLEIADVMGLRGDDILAFAVVTDFPLLEWSSDENRFVAMHHPFTMPKDEDLELLDTHPEKVRAKSYDIVLNGVELGSGSIRIHQREIQSKIFELLGFSREEAKERFGFLLRAFEYGTPPHGGFAFGLDRLIMLMAGARSIREVIAFPKLRDASCPMMNTPSKVSASQLLELDLYAALSEIGEDNRTEVRAEEMLGHVAHLARLNIEEDEKAELAGNLRDIIAFADQLAGVEIGDVDPLSYILESKNVFRDDEAKPSLPAEEVLKNASVIKDGCFYVPQSIS